MNSYAKSGFNSGSYLGGWSGGEEDPSERMVFPSLRRRPLRWRRRGSLSSTVKFGTARARPRACRSLRFHCRLCRRGNVSSARNWIRPLPRHCRFWSWIPFYLRRSLCLRRPPSSQRTFPLPVVQKHRYRRRLLPLRVPRRFSPVRLLFLDGGE